MPRSRSRFPFRLRPALVVLALLALLAAVAGQIAARAIEGRLVAALGPRAQVGHVSVGLASLTVHDLRIAAAPGGGWPAPDELRAAELVVRPGLRGLLAVLRGGHPWAVSEVVVRDAYLSALRTRDGRLHLVPALAERAAAREAGATARAPGQGDGTPEGRDTAGAKPAPSRSSDTAPAPAEGPVFELGEIRIEGATLEFVDASLHGGAPHRLRFESVQARVGNLVLPALDQPVSVDLAARLKGVERDGEVTLRGTLTPATQDAALAFRASGVDLVALQPYLFRLNDGGVRHGRLDLAVDAAVQRHHLHAPGEVTLTGLELAPGAAGGPFGAFGSGTRQAVIDLMSHDGRLHAKFLLDGRLDDPGFSLNEHLATRFAAGVADTLGVGVQGVVQGMGKVLKGLVGR